MNKIIFSSLLAVVIAFAFLLPQSIFAAEMTFKLVPNSEAVDDVTVIDVYIDPQSKELNLIEGELKFSGTASNNLSVQIENGHSILPIWPTPPQYDQNQQSITFAGGVPGGFSTESLLFRLHITQTISGALDITFTNGTAYLNDGQGTRESISAEPFEIDQDKTAEKGEVSDVDYYVYAIIILFIITVIILIYKYAYKENHKQ